MNNHRSITRSLILLCIFIVALTAGCGTDNPVSSEFSEMEQAIHRKINAHRASIGLPSLTLDATISTQAREHSGKMAAGTRTFGHDGFNDRTAEIIKTIPLDSAAENVAFTAGIADPVDTVVIGWLNSPGHRTNIQGGYNLTGIGIAKNSAGEIYFTQIFAKSR